MFRHLILAASLLLVMSCGQQTDPPSNGDPGTTGITIDAPATVISGQTISLRATLQGSVDSLSGLSWSTSGGGSFSDAQANPVSFTAPQVSSATQIRITAMLAADAARSATIEITVLPEGSFQAVVNTTLMPNQPSVPDPDGNPRTIACSLDPQGIQSDFVVGEVLVRPASEVELNDFLGRFDGTVLSDNTVPEPPPELGIVLDPRYRIPTEYLVRMNLAAVDAAEFSANAAILDIDGVMEFSSDAGLRTIAGVVDAAAAGFDASANYMSYPDQVSFPTPLFQTQEGPNPPLPNPAGRTDAFAITRCNADVTVPADGQADVWVPPFVPPPGAVCNPVFQSTGSKSNVTSAWQFVAAHGIERRVKVAIIDSGFWLNADGTPRGPDTDFPSGPGPNGRLIQRDFVGGDGDFIADGPGVMTCTSGTSCPWHGTGAAGVAFGVINNQAGAAGTGGMVADPILFKIDGTIDQRNDAIRAAVAWGADVVSMSFGGKRDSLARRIAERGDTPVKDEFDQGSKAVFVASAGNGECPAGATCPPTGTVGYDVGEPNFEHPCIWEHVICVGALNDDAKTKQTYSNFGAAVDIFAPTNIPVMPRPSTSNPNSPAGVTTFGGTSASAPFVAGVAAMMKAINPNLNSDQVSNILRETAHQDGVAPVTQYIDAFAAVQRAAAGIDGEKDHLDKSGPNGNDLIEAPTVLAGPPPWPIRGLSIHRPLDRDYFRFQVPGRSRLAIELESPQNLGPLSLFNFDELQGSCGAPAFVGDSVAGNTRFINFVLPGGTYVLGVGASAVTAYNLRLSLDASAIVAVDDYEINDTPATAARPTLLQTAPPENPRFTVRNDRININATLDHAGDVDYYILRGVWVSLVDLVYLRTAYPAVQVYGNESPLTLEVFAPRVGDCPPFMNLPREVVEEIPGWCLVGRESSPSCSADPATVPLAEGEERLVRVRGDVGRYELANRIEGEERNLPYLVRDRVYEVLHPGEPVEDGIPFPKLKVFVADAAFSGIKLTGADLHLELFDFDGNPVTEGLPGSEPGCDEILDLAVTRPGDIYTLQITPLTTDPDGLPLRLEWQPAEPVQVSGNLILNPGAEDGPAEEEPGGAAVSEIPSWYVPANPPTGAVILPMASMPTVLYYDENGLWAPTPTAPGPEQRGLKLFVGGPYSSPSAIQQFVTVDSAWNPAINAGRVRFTMSAFLGGWLAEGDAAQVSLEFRTGDDFELLGQVTLPAITPLDREDQTGLWPVAGGGVVPAGTNFILVNLVFLKTEGDYTDAYADNLELILAEYGE